MENTAENTAQRTNLNCNNCGGELRYFGLERPPDAFADFWACPRCSMGLCGMLESWPCIGEARGRPIHPIPGPWRRRLLPGETDEAEPVLASPIAPSISGPECAATRERETDFSPVEWLLVTVAALCGAALLFYNLGPFHR